MSFWICRPSDFERMGDTYRRNIGINASKILGYKVDTKGYSLDDWGHVAALGLEQDVGPLVPRWVVETVPRDTRENILDFGCGAGAVQVRALRELGYAAVSGFEWEPTDGDASGRSRDYWSSRQDGLLDPNPRPASWGIVLASNVVNVQPTWACFWVLLETIRTLMTPSGVFITNLASEPRRILSNGKRGEQQLQALLEFAFEDVTYHKGPIWECRSPNEPDDVNERNYTLELLDEGVLDYTGGL